MEDKKQPLLCSAPGSSSSPEAIWTSAFHELGMRLRGYFVRPEMWIRACAYLRGLLSPIERKNGWQIAEEAGESTPYAIQHLLGRAKWESDGVRDELQRYVHETFGDANAVLVIDETGFLKKRDTFGGSAATIQWHGWAD